MKTVKNLIFVIIAMSFGFMQDASLQITNYSAETGQLEISMMNSQNVGGIQLQLESSDSTTVVSGASGGSAADAGFTLSTNSSGTILGFSFSGTSIPTSDNMVPLVYVDLTFSDETVSFQFDVSSSTLSSTAGTGLDAYFGESFEVGGVVILGCMDENACNYNPEATEDDGSCTYSEYCSDCDGNCTCFEDCSGECDGSDTSCFTIDEDFLGAWYLEVAYFQDDCSTLVDGSYTCDGDPGISYQNEEDCEAACSNDCYNLYEFVPEWAIFSDDGTALVGLLPSDLCDFDSDCENDDWYSGSASCVNNECYISQTNYWGVSPEGCFEVWDEQPNDTCNEYGFNQDGILEVTGFDNGFCQQIQLYGTSQGCMDESATNYNNEAEFPCFDCCEYVEPHYQVAIDETGESTLFIFESGIANLSIGDELGIFDSNGVIDSTGATGEILVGAGTWNGSQLEVVGIQAVDLSQFGGPILPGANEGNSMTLKVWSPSLETEFDVTYTISSGTGTFNGLFTAIGAVEFCEVPEGTCDCDGTLPTQCWDGSTTCNNDCPAFFNVEIAETGESTLFIFQDTIDGLDVGDELGIYDANGTLDSTGAMGEILVGSGVWTGSQLEIVGIQAVDLSQFGGPILPGANEGNTMSLKVFKLSDQMTYDVTYGIGSGTGTFNGLFTAIESVEFAPEYTVVINEFFFRANEEVPDYVELYNFGMEDVDLSGWSLTDGEDPFDGSFDGYTLAAGEYLLLAGEDPFFNSDGDELYAGEDIDNSLLFDIGLSTSSDVIMLLDADANEVDFVSYDNDNGWPTGNDFRGHAAELSDPFSDNGNPANWDTSNAEGSYMYTEDGVAGEDFGTPGEQNSNYTAPILGCTDDMACNYDETATMDDGSCEYPDYYAGECDCDGNLFDCNGVCGGDSFIDDCGGCVDAGTNPDDCLDADNLPTEFSLSQNYPNPFNPVTSINFDVAENGKINLDVYDIKGNHISSLISSYYSVGSYAIQWDGVDSFGAEVASGVYIYQLRYPSGLITKKMTLIR